VKSDENYYAPRYQMSARSHLRSRQDWRMVITLFQDRRELRNETGGKNMSGMESEQCLVLNMTKVHRIPRSPTHPTLIHLSLVSTASTFRGYQHRNEFITVIRFTGQACRTDLLK
jgi:hypothetical protein